MFKVLVKPFSIPEVNLDQETVDQSGEIK